MADIPGPHCGPLYPCTLHALAYVREPEPIFDPLFMGVLQYQERTLHC